MKYFSNEEGTLPSTVFLAHASRMVYVLNPLICSSLFYRNSRIGISVSIQWDHMIFTNPIPTLLPVVHLVSFFLINRFRKSRFWSLVSFQRLSQVQSKICFCISHERQWLFCFQSLMYRTNTR